MDRRAAGALLALAACFASSAAAPTVSNQTSLDLYDAASEGCYYNFQHYGEGDRIMTNEPCLNCTCHNRMLMCYLRVCPFTKPIGQDCTVEKRADQCCPIVTCPDVPVDLLTSTSTSSPAEYGATGLGKLDKYGCSINGKYFPEGSKVPPTPNKPCEHCYCIRNMTTCVMQECTLHVDGCTPIYHKDVCCPVRYSCDHPEDEMPLLDDMSTTVRPTPGFLLTTTTLSPVTQMTQDCVHNDQIFTDGTSIKTEKACEHCYCMKGDIVCVVQECGTPMENEGKNCTSVAPREGQCCPDTYICEGDEVTSELMLDYTTEMSTEKLITLVPPRRVLDEGSGYRKEEEPVVTELPAVEPEVEGSGEEFATMQPSDETETPSLIDERISSTEDDIGRDTTLQTDIEIEKATTEPNSELNTVPSGTVEASEPSVVELTTVAVDTKSNEETEQTHADSQYTTASLETKDEEILTQTTEPAFRKEDESIVPLDITTSKITEYYTTSEFEPTKTTKEESIGIVETTEQEQLVTVIESKLTTPTSLEEGQTGIVTEIPITTAHDELAKEPSVTTHGHEASESSTTVVTEKSETTTLNAQENEIEDVSTTQAPGRIPGEGDCLQNGITYRNESAVPSINNCQTDCTCVSSIIKCDPIICSDPPEYMSNCVPTYDSLESCCPTYVCDGSKETLPPQPHSQMSETISSTPTPAIDCEGDQCEGQKADKPPKTVSSDIPQTSSCGSEDCKDLLQTPVQIDVQPECTSEDCSSKIKPDLHDKQSTISPVASESCFGSECQQKPIEKEDSVQPCEGDNCKTPPIQLCQNEEECKSVHIPEVKLPCEGESCKIEPTDCSDEGCKLPPELSPVSSLSCEGENCKVPVEQCQNEEECKTINIPKIDEPCKGESCKIDPTECSDEGCKISGETQPAEPTCEGSDCKISPIEPPKVELPCEGESCKLEPTECNDESCKIPPSTSPIPTCEGENCKIPPIETCQNEEECKTVNITKVEVPCEGESCQNEPAPEKTPVQPSCIGDNCSSKDEQELECVGEDCKKNIIPDITGELPTKCNGADCLSETSVLPETSGTESPLSTQNQEAEITPVTTKYLDSTKTPESISTETPQTSEASTDKSYEVTKLEETQTEYSTDYPERKTTDYVVTKETTPVPDSEIQTEIRHELEVTTTSTLVQSSSPSEEHEVVTEEAKPEPQESSTPSEEHEVVTEEAKPEPQESSTPSEEHKVVTEEAKPEPQESSTPSEKHEVVTEKAKLEPQESSTTLEEHEVVTEESKLPEEQVTPEETSAKPEETTEKQEKVTQPTVLSDSKSETGTTEPAFGETPTQSEQERLPEFTISPEISTVPSLNEQYTAVPKLDVGKEATTESVVKPTEQSVSQDEIQVSKTEMSTKGSEVTSEAPITSPTTDDKITTTPSDILEISTEESRSGTPETPGSPTTSSGEDDELPSKKTKIPDEKESIPQTTSIPQPHIDYSEPGKQDGDTTSKFDLEPQVTTSQPSSLLETDVADTEKPIVDEDKVPEIPSEEIFIESPEINTEGSPLFTQDESTAQEAIEPESPYIPVHPTIADKLESDLIDKDVTTEISPEVVSSTEHKLDTATPESIPEAQTLKPSIESKAPDIEDGTKTTPAVNKEQYEHDMRVTEPPSDILPTDTRKYNKDTTESPEPIATEDKLTTSYPTEEKQSEAPTYSETTTSKSSQEEEQFTTVPAEILSTEKQEVIPTEVPESHVQETESEVKLSTSLEMGTTERLKPIESEETQTPSPSDIEPTESQSPIQPVNKGRPEEELEKATTKAPEPTSEPKFEYYDTTPEMIELVEHNEMQDISTLPSSISDERTTISPDTEISDDKLTTEKLETPIPEAEAGKSTTTSLPISEDTEDKMKDEITTTPSNIMKDHQVIPEQPQDADSHKEVKPDSDIATLKPDIDEITPESIPVQETTTEIVQIDESHYTKHPDITNLEQITGQPEDTGTEKPDILDSDKDRLTTRQPEEPVTDLKIKPVEGLVTEEPGSGEMEVKPDKDYLTEKPDIEQLPISEQESTPTSFEQPSIDEQPVTDKSMDTTQPEVPTIDNEIIPDKEKVEPTVPSVSETEDISEKDIVTVEPEYVVTKSEDLKPLDEEFVTETPVVTETIKESEIESSTENKFLPDEGISTGGSDIPVTEKEPGELATIKPESPEIEPSTKLPISTVSEDDNQSPLSTVQAELITPESSTTTKKESVTEIPVFTETEQETKAPGEDDTKLDEGQLTTSLEKEYTTAKSEVDFDTTKETVTVAPEHSDIEKESEHKTTTILSETKHKLPAEETTTEQLLPSIDQETVSEMEPTERDTVTELESITEEQASVTEDSSHKLTTAVPLITEIEDKLIEESSTHKVEEETSMPLEPETETTKPDISLKPVVPELSTKEPETSETAVPEHATEPQKRYTTDEPEILNADHEATTEAILVEKEPSITEHAVTIEPETGTKESQEQTLDEMPAKTTIIPFVESLDDKETSTTKSEHIDDSEKLSTSGDSSSTSSSNDVEEFPAKLTEATPESHSDIDKQDGDITRYTTPGYTLKDETTGAVSETEKPTISEEGLPVHTQPELEKPIDLDLTKDTTAPEEEFLTVTTKATTPKAETETPIHSEDLDKTPKPQETPEETSSAPTPEVPKPGLNDVQATDEVPVPEEEGHFPPSATGGYGQEPDYEDENQAFGPGTCRYGGKVYVSAQQIPRDDPCDFCFCFRSDIICLQQSCPPPIHGCHEEPIQGFCCPRYECPVSMASTLNITTTTTTTTTTLPPHFLPHAYQGAVQKRGCQIKGHTYKVGEVVRASSGPCLHCTCGGDGQMKCDPKACTPEPMLRQMIAAAVSAKRRR